MSSSAAPPPLPKRSRIAWFIVPLIGLVTLSALVVALFHPVENWRGKRVWESCQSELRAKGQTLDWAAFVPPAVPEEQNILKASKMAEWLMSKGTNELVKRLDTASLYDFSRHHYTNVVVELTVLSPEESFAPGEGTLVLRYDAPILKADVGTFSSPTDASPELIPLVVLEDVPLRQAIKNLARNAKLDYVLDRSVDFKNPSLPEPAVSGRWEDITAQQVLFAVLNDHQLQWNDDPKTGIARVTRGKSGSPQVHIDSAVRKQIGTLIHNAIEINPDDFQDPGANDLQGPALVLKSVRSVSPARLFVRARTAPDLKEVRGFFPVTALISGTKTIGLRVESDGGKFRLVLSPPPYTPSDYLAWSDRFEADFTRIRQGLQRPYARPDGDYQEPLEIPIPNWLALRSVTQTLAKRAECHLLMARPDKALDELTLISDLCHFLENGKPMSLVAAMSEAAVIELYARKVAQGLRLHAWREPQLTAIQDQLKTVNLPVLLANGLQTERAAILRTLEILPPGGKFWKDVTHPKLWRIPLMPRGWFYQNLARIALLEQYAIESLDVTNKLVIPRRAKLFEQEIKRVQVGFRPYSYIAAIVIPDFTKALQKAALEQTYANEAVIACALERYRMVHGQYPETLDALSPKFAAKVPPDVINGQPLNYQRSPDGQYSLYSVGWNERNEGGLIQKDHSRETAKGDWVWPPAD